MLKKLLLGCFVSNCAYGQNISQQLDAYMQSLTKLNRFSGTVVVAQGNKVLLNKGYGFANYEFDVPNSAHIKFALCSISKMFTAVAILQLQEKGLLHINDPINKYIPDYPRGDEITIHHLLSQTSGIAASACNLLVEMMMTPITEEQMISLIKNKPLEYVPGTDYQYSNANYVLLAALIEKVSGKKYEIFMKENILSPLNMNASCFGAHDHEILKNCASGYRLNEANDVINAQLYAYAPKLKGAGGLHCSAYDLYTFACALTTGALINEASLQTMFTPYSSKENYGYGCGIHVWKGRTFVEHGGMASTGFKTNVSMFIEDGVFIVILSNFFHGWVNEARDALAAIIFNEPYELPCCDSIKVDPSIYNDYIGAYDYPNLPSGYKVETRGGRLYLPENTELSPVGKDQFIAAHRKADNIVYTFMRDGKGQVNQLRIKGGAPYFELRCDKITSNQESNNALSQIPTKQTVA